MTRCGGIALLFFLFVGRAFADDLSRTKSDSPVTKLEQIRAIQQGLEWIRNHQGEDGGWCSINYAPLRPGAGVTARMLALLAELPLDDRKRLAEQYQRGVRFLLRKFRPGNSAGLLLKDVDYPLYAAAYFLSAQSQVEGERTFDLKPELVHFLQKQQRLPQNGWPADRMDVGGWSPWMESPGDVSGQPPANVSVTCAVLTALQQAGGLTDDVKSGAARFLKRCEAPVAGSSRERGMAFTPWPDSPFNKGGTVTSATGDIQPLAYHSATTDGLRIRKILAAPGEETLPEDVLRTWLQMPRARLVGDPEREGEREPLQSALFFYDAAAFGGLWQERTREEKSENALVVDRARLLMVLVRSQREDGSWMNPLPWFFEDDPFIATPLALSALIRLQSP